MKNRPKVKFGVRLDQSLFDRLVLVAKSRRMSMSRIARQALEAAIGGVPDGR